MEKLGVIMSTHNGSKKVKNIEKENQVSSA